jgi:hypothetical protein
MLGVALAVPGLFASHEGLSAQRAGGRGGGAPAAAQGGAPAAPQAAPANPSLMHLGHVADRFTDTPQNRGFAATATAEAAVMTQHAGLAGQQPDNLEYMKQHTVHVVNAVDPSVEAAGPGLGYGVKKAAQNSLQHMELAAAANGASTAMGILAKNVSASANNVVRWSDELIALGNQVKASTDAATAAGLVKQIATLAEKIANGSDANTDGTISARDGEGGLRQMESQLTLLKRAEGLAGAGGEP